MNLSRPFRSRSLLTASLLLLLLSATPAPALIMVGKGNAPVADSGWPAGALDVANLKTRVGWWEGPPFGGGEWTFLYRGDTAALEEIALAGSGGMGHFIPTAGDVVGTLTTALTSISGMVTCNYAIPAGSNPALVNVQITVGQTGMPTDIGKVADLAACGPPGGWYYDNNITPTQIILCPQTCDPVQMTANSGVEVLYGCPSEPPK